MAVTGSGTARTTIAPRPILATLRSALRDLRFPLGLGAAIYFLLLPIAWNAPHVLPAVHVRGNGSVLPASDPLADFASWTRPWFRFDTAWYVGVAQHGYHWGAGATANTNFLPVYPALIRLLTPATLGSPWLAAWIISTLAYLTSLCLLWSWAGRRWDRARAQRCLFLVAAFPFAFFFVTPYAEPLFLALAVASFLLAEQGSWRGAWACAALSTVTRPVGTAVVIALAVMAVQQRRYRQAALMLLAELPLACFALYLGLRFGHPLGFLVSHSGGWVPPHGGILSSLAAQFHTYLTPFDRIDAAIAVLMLGSGLLVWRRLGAPYAVYTLGGVLLPLAHGLVGIERYAIVLFPAMAVWSGAHRRLQLGLFALSVTGLIAATTMFAAGYTLI